MSGTCRHPALVSARSMPAPSPERNRGFPESGRNYHGEESPLIVFVPPNAMLPVRHGPV